MKTINFVALSDEQVKAFGKMFNDEREKYNDRKAVVNQLRKGMKKMDDAVAKIICALIESNWEEFNGYIISRLPHYTRNGKIINCDWVKKTDKSKLLMVKDYRFDVYSDVVVREVAQEAAITQTIVEKQRVKIGEYTDKDGSVTPVYKMDGGKFVTEDVEVAYEFVPRDKNAWGFTETMKAAFFLAIDDLVKAHATDKKESK